MKVRGFSGYLLITLICLPLFFINIKSSQEWGDDFAQYLQQAANISDGKPQSQSGYLYNPEYPEYAPPSYPAGFPVLLAPVYKFSGGDIHTLSLYISLFLFAFAIAIYHFLKKYFSSVISTLLVVIFIYNPWTLSFKIDIISDIPFSLFFLLSFLIYSKEDLSLRNTLLLSLLLGFTMSIRNVGIVWILAFTFEILRELKSGNISTLWKNKKSVFHLKLIIFSMCIFILINKIIFKSSADGLFSYKYFFNFYDLKQLILYNLAYYSGVMRAFFEPWNDQWQFVPIISGTMIFAFIILGIVKKITSGYHIINTLLIIYLCVIIVYPYSNAGFRFLLPLSPFILYYLMYGLRSVDIKINLRQNTLAILLTLLVLFSYKKGISEILKSQNNIEAGPQENENAEMISYIIQNTPAEARFYFTKPRALAFYTKRNAITHKRNRTISEIRRTLSENNIQFILINPEVGDDSLNVFVNTESGLRMVWENGKNRIYRY